MCGWLGSRVVTVLDSGAEGPGFKSQSRRCRVTKQTVHTHCAYVYQAAKLVAVLLRVAGVTAGQAESNGSLPSGLWFTSPAGWLPRTGISSGTLRSVIEYGLPLPFTSECFGVKFLIIVSVHCCWTVIASACYRSARRALSSKPASGRCCCRSMGETDRQTDPRPFQKTMLHILWQQCQ